MNLYVSSTLLWHLPVDEVIRIVSKKRVKGVEVWAEQVWYHQTPVEKIMLAKYRYGLDLTLHAASWDLNLCALNEGIRLQSIQEVMKSFHLAKEIGAENVTIHPGKVTLKQGWTSWHLQQLEKSITILSQYANQFGLTLSLELMEEKQKELLVSPKEMNQFLENVPVAVKTTFDIAHIPRERDILTDFHQLKRVNKVHISDSTAHKYHVPLGQGELDILPILNELYYTDLPVVIEGYDDQPGQEVLMGNLKFLHQHFSLIEEEVAH